MSNITIKRKQIGKSKKITQRKQEILNTRKRKRKVSDQECTTGLSKKRKVDPTLKLKLKKGKVTTAKKTINKTSGLEGYLNLFVLFLSKTKGKNENKRCYSTGFCSLFIDTVI